MSVVGIDLGTTNTVVACVRSGKVHVLADEHGARLLPSVVSFHPNGEVLVGASAKSRRVIDPKNTVYSHKRLIGRSWGSPEIAQAKQRFAFELREGPGQGPLVHARGQDYTLPEISAFVLKRARQIGEAALGTPVERAVITVPAHFNELQRASTKVAGRVSGVEVLRILNEPTAAALAYGLGRTGNERVAVYDFGGGTFDCTLLDLNGNVFEVLATAGDSFLGGDDIDLMIADRMAEAFLKQHRQEAKSDPQMYERLKTTAEDIKIGLSTAESHTVTLKEFGFGAGGAALTFTYTMSRKDLDAMITPLVERSFKVTQDALSLARLTPTSFDKVILVGGSTRIPLIKKRVEAFFGAPPMDRVNPDEVVAIGAAIQAAALTEGAKKRSIPAAPPVPGAGPRTQPGLQADAADPTGTSEFEKAGLKPAFGSQPPAFGFQTAPSSQVPDTRGGPPPTGATGARHNQQQQGGPRKITNPGVAPATRPQGERKPAAPTQAQEDDPSIASFPDLKVPTPFEWFPSSQPGSADPGATKQSERSFGQAPDNTMTKTAAVPPSKEDFAKTNPRPAAGTAPDPSGSFQGFGAVDEPPSLYSTPSASVPSFPSMSANVPSPTGEPLPGQFGEVRDMSLISSTAMAPADAAKTAPGFGHVSDLSLISSSNVTNANEAITEARKKAALDGTFDDSDDTEALHRASPAKPVAPAPIEEADLPTAVPQTDLPASLSRGKNAPKRSPGMSPTGGSAMLGKPPPAAAPQPFGKMEKIKEEPHTSPPRTSPMAARPAPAPAAGRPAPSPAATQKSAARPPPAQQVSTAPMPERPSLDNTSPLGKSPVAATSPFGSSSPFATNAPGAFASNPGAAFASAPPAAFGSAPPAFNTQASQQQQPFNMPPAPAPMAPSAPPPMMAPPPAAAPPPQMRTQMGYGGPQPPPQQQQPQPQRQPPSQPPAAYGQQPYPSSPPQGAETPFDPNLAFPPNQGGGQQISYAAPVLVDVTPRGLVVETAGGYTDTIIPRNSKIPCERTRRFATGRDMQTMVRVRVAQGEHPHFPQNTYLGEVELSGLRPAHRGDVVVAVTFEVDADGTLRVRARDVQTGQEARAVLQLIGVADESSVVMMINRFANQPVVGGPTH